MAQLVSLIFLLFIILFIGNLVLNYKPIKYSKINNKIHCYDKNILKPFEYARNCYIIAYDGNLKFKYIGDFYEKKAIKESGYIYVVCKEGVCFER